MATNRLITDPTLVALHRYWRSKFDGDRLPSRQAIDPTEIPALLPWIFLMDVGHDPLSFRYRLIGTGIVNFLGRDFTGRIVNFENYGDRAEAMASIFRTAVDRRDVTAVRGQLFYVRFREFLRFCWTMMPLSSDGTKIDMLFCGYVPDGTSLGTTGETMTMDTAHAEIVREPIFGTEDIALGQGTGVLQDAS